MTVGSTLRRCQTLLRPTLPTAYQYLEYMNVCLVTLSPPPECKQLEGRKPILVTTVTPVPLKQKQGQSCSR